MPNILTTAERCRRGEGHAFMWTAVGDVTRCKHGRIAVIALEREARAAHYRKKETS